MARAPSIAVPASPVPRSGDVQTKGWPPVLRAPAARDPRFTGMVQGIGGAVQPVRAHPSGAQKAGEAQAAAEHPKDEGVVQGEANHAAGIEDAPTKPPVPDDFIEALKKRLDKAIPEDKAGAEAFMSGKDPAGGAKQASKAALLQQRDQSAGPMKDASSAKPSPAASSSQPVGEDLPPPAAPPRPGVVPTAGAVPPSLNRRPPSPRALGERADDAMSKGKITPDLLQNGGDPSFNRVLAQRKKAEAALREIHERLELAHTACSA